MRVLIVNVVAKTGSTGQITYGLHKRLKKQGHESVFCYGRGADYPEEPDMIRVDTKAEVYTHAALTRVTGYQGFFSRHATRTIIALLDSFKPDLVVCGNLHGYYLSEFAFLQAIKERGILCFYYMFDEYPFLGKCPYSGSCQAYKSECGECPSIRDYPSSWIFDRSNAIFQRKNAVYAGFDKLNFITVPYNAQRAATSALIKNNSCKVYDIGWGIDVNTVYYPRDCGNLREELGIPPENKVVLSVGPSRLAIKGMQYYTDAAAALCGKNITFIQIGFDGDRASCPPNYIPLGYMRDQDLLARYYTLADIFVNSSIDVTYPTVNLIALACGTPVYGFDISGIPYIAPTPYGTYVEACNTEALATAINEAPRKTREVSAACRTYAITNFDMEAKYDKLIMLAEEKLGDKGGTRQ